MRVPRAELYLALAEVVAEPPGWLALSGKEWPLFACASSLATASKAAARAAEHLAQIGAEPLALRRARYEALLAAPGQPRFSLYESLQRSGRLLGSEMLAVERLYRVAGLEIAGDQLPDHASLELAFLAYLAWKAASDSEHTRQWQRIERHFIRKHAGRWLPEVGRAIAASGDAVYAPVGLLLAQWLEETLQRRRNKRPLPQVPRVSQAGCTFCGFCVQICPTGALQIEEDQTETALLLCASRCSGCGLCIHTCTEGAMQLVATGDGRFGAETDSWQMLRVSPRAACPGCGEPTVSRAELEFVTSQIGPAPWLEYCLRCRTS